MNYQRKNCRCILCFKPSFTSSNLSGFDSKFLLLLSRHLKIRPESKPPEIKENDEFVFCEDCSELGSSFCDLYSQLECIRLQVNWKMRKIYETMLCAGRVSSRFNAFKKQFETRGDNDDERDKIYTKIVQLRKSLMKQSKQTLRLSLPKIHLKRICGGNNNIKMEQNSPNKAAGIRDNSTPTPPNDNHQLLAALMSYVAVLHLSLPLHPSHIPNNYENDQNCFAIQDFESVTQSESSEPENIPSDDQIPQQIQSGIDDLDDSPMEDFSVASEVEESLAGDEVFINNAKNCEISEFSDKIVEEDDADSGSPLEHQVKEETSEQPMELDRSDVPEAPECFSPVAMEVASEVGFTPLQSDLDEISQEVVADPPRKSLRSLLQCKSCPKTFTTQASLASHLKLHDDFVMDGDSSESESSSSDDEAYVDPDNLKVEESDDEQEDEEDDDDMDFQEEHSSEDEELGDDFRSKSTLKQPTAPNECEICHETLECEAAVEKHRVLKHKLTKYVRCPVCLEYFRHYDSYYIHRTRSELIPCFISNPKDLKPAAAPVYPPQMSKMRGRFFCKYADCYEVFNRKGWLQIHLKTHGNWDCSQCPEKFSKAHEFAMHELTSHNSRALTDPDVAKFLRKSCLKDRAKGNPKYVCSRCPRAVRTQRGIVTHFLLAHLEISKTSTDLKKQCKICKKLLVSTITKKQMKNHYEIHNVEGLDPSEIFTCGICQAPFNKRANLTTHLQIVHKQVISLNCPHCPETFTNPAKLTAHVDEFHKEFQSDSEGNSKEELESEDLTKPIVPNTCEQCSETFDCELAVQKHRVLKHKLSKYVRCEVCGQFFASRHLYLLHRTKLDTIPCFTAEPEELEKVSSMPNQYPFTGEFGGRKFCPVEDCFEVFLYQEWHDIHIKTHGNWNCNFCSEEFAKLHLLAFHEISEHGKNQDAPSTSQITSFCTRCDGAFESKNNAVTHFLEEHCNIPKVPRVHQISSKTSSSVNQPNKCEVCDEIFSCEAAVEKHRVVDHNLERYIRCKSCFQFFSSPLSLLTHRTKSKFSPCFTTNPKDLKPAATPIFPIKGKRLGRLFCTIEGCYEVFLHEEWRQIHLKTHGNWNCTLCPEEFSKAHDFAWHELTTHNSKSLTDPDVLQYSKVRKQRKMEFVCSRCPSAFLSKTRIIAHFLYNHLDIPKVYEIPTGQKECEICKKVMSSGTSEKAMKQHYKMHDVEGMDPAAISTCSICQAHFNKRHYLTAHLRLEHKHTLRYKCPHCEKQFKHYTGFKAHLKRKHKGESSGLAGAFQCEICQERFSTKPNFERHKKSHERVEESVKCEICDKVFSTTVKYQRHVLYMHKPVTKTWHCDKCGKIFKSDCKLKQHTSYTHTDPSLWKFTCPEEGCGKKCWSNQKLTEHVRTHSKERPFVCDVCGESYRFRQYLRSHLAKVHGSSAAKTLPTQSYVKPFDQTVKLAEEEEGSDESSSSST